MREDDFLVDAENVTAEKNWGEKHWIKGYLDAKIGVDPAENDPRKECDWRTVRPARVRHARTSASPGAGGTAGPSAPRGRPGEGSNLVKILSNFSELFRNGVS